MRRRMFLLPSSVIDLSAAVVTATTQTYSGSAKTPTPIVTLNDIVIPSTEYDVAYSNNVNAGIATITITGKGDYVGTATGTFTINKVTPTVTAPIRKSLTYSGVAQTLANAGSTDYGTLQYSADNSTWSTTIPTGTNASTNYKVYYRVVGDSNVNDVVSANISCSISQKSLSITAKAQTITYGSSISQSTSQVTTSGLVSGDNLTSITLTQSTSSVTSSGTITPSNAATSNGISNYSVSYYTGTLTITQATGSVVFLFDSIGATYNPYDTTASLRVSTSSSGWEKTTAKTVSGYNVFRSINNKHKDNTSSVMKLTFVNNTGAAVTTTVKVGAATESSYDYVYIAQWNASDVSPSSSNVPSSTLYTGSNVSTEWTDVSITIPTGTNTLQIVYRKDSSVSNEPDCGYFALPYNVSMASMVGSSVEYNTNASISYSSSNTSVVSVNSSTGAITINGVGTATITASASATTEYSSCSDSHTITVSAYKVAPTYTAPTLRTGLTYSGSSQYLTTTGSTSHGTIYYSTNNSNWYTNRRTGTTATSYSCYWKLVGDTYHLDVDSTYLGSTTIAKASRTLSFADSYMVLNTSSTGTKTATPSAGSGDGAITYSIANTTYATINSSTGAVTSKTSDGSATVTATIAEGDNYLSASASYTLYVFATTHNYSYTGSYSSTTLPPGTYQFQVWGAQGGSNAADSQYGITSKAGGKGGYSVGQLTVSQATAVRVYVGGQGGSSSAGYNGGGSSWGASIKDADNELGVTKCASGGGASDIRLSDGSLYSRMIVAGGGSGGAMCYQKKTTQVEKDVVLATYGYTAPDRSSGLAESGTTWISSPYWADGFLDVTAYQGKAVYLTYNRMVLFLADMPSVGDTVTYLWRINAPSNFGVVIPSNCKYIAFTSLNYVIATQETDLSTIKAEIHGTQTETEVTENWDYQVGYAGGGTNGLGYSSTYYGKQNAAGNQGEFGVGATQHSASWRYVSGAGGGGWYGGGREISNYSLEGVKMSGGGSGFVNTSANAGNRPSGYTGLQLDSGTTYAGNTSFPAPGGGNETGHSGNGYVRITRL